MIRPSKDVSRACSYARGEASLAAEVTGRQAQASFHMLRGGEVEDNALSRVRDFEPVNEPDRWRRRRTT